MTYATISINIINNYKNSILLRFLSNLNSKDIILGYSQAEVVPEGEGHGVRNPL